MNVNLYSRSHHRHIFTISLMVLVSLMAAFPLNSYAQPRRSCGTMDHLQEQMKADPGIRSRMRRIEDNTQMNAKSSFHRVTGKVTIPVVVHVVYRVPGENISDAQIASQLKVLNDDFQRRNADKIHTPQAFLGVASNTGISFQLATTDPEGNPTTGITRTPTSQFAFYSHNNGVKYSAMGGVDPWPTTEYLNIWVCNLGMGVLGYAQFPGGPSVTDGVVIGYKYFGTIGNLTAPFNKGRTTTHEVGHWLNLRHIWGDGPCGVDDFVTDTPPADKPNHGCASGHSSCGSVNMVQNFMDYTDDECMNLFTQGQADRMRALFAAGGFRRSLMFSKGLESSSVPNEPIAFIPPENISAENITDSKALLTWSEVLYADSYNARFRRAGSSNWSMRNFKKTEVRVTGLNPCTDYEFQVESVFEGVGTGFTESSNFSTGGCSVVTVNDNEPPPLMRAPSGLYVTDINGSRATINWSNVQGATSYKIQYKAAGSSSVKSKEVTNNSITIADLDPGPIYLYRVRANFGQTPGPYSKTSFFIPAIFASRMRASGPPKYIQAYHDVNKDVLKVKYDLPETGPVRISILDPSDRVVEEYRPFMVREGVPFELNMQKLAGGNYQIKIEDEQGFEHFESFVIRR